MSPRKLRLVRVEDDRISSVVSGPDFPLQADKIISRWSGFLADLQCAEQSPMELLAIDIEFGKDPGAPQIEALSIDAYKHTRYDPNFVHESFRGDPDLGDLVWPPALRCFGKNNGILIGAMLAGRCLAQDLPLGVGVHTGHPRLPAHDMNTAMLVAQILAVSGALRGTQSNEQALRLAVQNLSGQNRRIVEHVLPEMLDRFRTEFLHRAGEGRRLLVEPASLDRLLSEFAAATSQVDLDARLAKHGIMLYDREGSPDCLDVRSIFADLVLTPAMIGDPPHLRLDDVRPPAPGKIPGVVYRFIEELSAQSFDYVGPVIEYFQERRKAENIDASLEAERPLHEFIALLFAWCYTYAENLLEKMPWNPNEERYEPESHLPSRHAQARALFQILDKISIEGSDRWAHWNVRQDYVPLTSDSQLSIMDAVRYACENERFDDTLFYPLRYDQKGDRNLAGRRRTAVAHLLDDLVRSGHVDRVIRGGERWYKLIADRAPDVVAAATNRVRILELLGSGVKDPTTPFHRILRKVAGTGFEGYTSEEFFKHLEHKHLPMRFARLCQHFMRAVWPEIPEPSWPKCIRIHRKQTMEPIITGDEPDPKERARLEEIWKRDVDAQRRLQELYVPLEGRSAAGDAYYRVQQADGSVGGDYVKLAEAADGSLSLLLADAPGHGHSAMSLAIALAVRVNDHTELLHQPAAMLANLNSVANEAGRYIPALHVTISPDRKALRYANAGLHPGLLIREDGVILPLESIGTPLGTPKGLAATERAIPLQPGDRIVLYTDGLEDATNLAGVPFGRLRIEIAAVGCRTLPPEDMVNTILDEARAFCDECPWEDDVTVAVIAVDAIDPSAIVLARQTDSDRRG
jgi:hypothetical protein